MISRPYKAYLSVVSKEEICTGEAREKMGIAGANHPDFAQGELGRKQADNFKKQYDTIYNECIKNWASRVTDVPKDGVYDIGNLLGHPYFIPAIAVVVLIAVGVLVGKAIK